MARYTAALSAFEQALRLRPDNALYLFNRGLALDRLPGRTSDSADAFAAATAADPAMPEAHYRRGVALDQLQQFAAACDSFRAALDAIPATLYTRPLQISASPSPP